MKPTGSAAVDADHPLLSLLADGAARGDVLSALHRRALDATGGACSLLLERNPGTGELQATSGAGVDRLPTTPWSATGAGATLHTIAMTSRRPVVVTTATDAPRLRDELGMEAALILPLTSAAGVLGVVAIGLAADASPVIPDHGYDSVRAAFVLALELSRLRQREVFEQDVRALLDSFADQLGSTLDLTRALEPLCVSATRLFGADRTTVWVHDRESRKLTPLASSDAGHVASLEAVRADDPLAPAAAALRLARAGLSWSADVAGTSLSVPLRGCRRALGAVVIEGLRIEAGDDLNLLARADELGRQLSASLESVQMIGTITRSREGLRDQLLQAEKLAALGQFVAGIAHELNNPLQSVLGHLELLLVTGAIPQALRPDVQTVFREADRAAHVVRGLMIFAGHRHLQRRPCRLNRVLDKVLAGRRAALTAQAIEVVRNYDRQLPRIVVDPQMLHEVFLNIVMNAESAVAPAGAGRIEVSTGLGDGGSRVVATVRDNGPGLSEDVLVRAFEPFYTTRDVGKGIGLGLAVAYGIVQEHGGRISASNHPDGGAVFTVDLPVS
jgi:signal transduction histidine kinase